MLTEEEEDEFFGEDGHAGSGSHADAATTAKIAEEMTSAGYVEARDKARADAMQRGFDEAYPRGLQLGKVCGKAAVMLKQFGGSTALLQTIEAGELVQMTQAALIVWLSSLLAELQRIAAEQPEESHGQRMIGEVNEELQRMIAGLSLA